MVIKLGDTVHVVDTMLTPRPPAKRKIIKTGRVIQITKTIIFNPPSTKILYKLDDNIEYKKEQLVFDKELSRDNRLKDILN